MVSEVKVTVIVPTYNRAHMAPETIDSILAQTFKDFELIIVDNYSKDNTEKMVKKYIKKDKRIRYYKNQNNGIISVNRNYGIRKAGGELIAFCDDDDLWLPDKLERQLAEFEKDSSIGLVCGNGINFNEEGEFGLISEVEFTDEDFTFEALLQKNRVVSASVMIKKEVLDDVGLFKELRELIAGEDYHLWLRVAKKYKIKYLFSPLIKYRTHQNVERKDDLAGHILLKDVFKSLMDDGYLAPALYKKLISEKEQDFEYDNLIDFILNDKNYCYKEAWNVIPTIMNNNKINFFNKNILVMRWCANLIAPKVSNQVADKLFQMKMGK
jgi:glycosyltransferase involved in cell wall biosynthesis